MSLGRLEKKILLLDWDIEIHSDQHVLDVDLFAKVLISLSHYEILGHDKKNGRFLIAKK